MSEYKPGQKVLLKTSYRKDGKYVLAGRPATIVERIGGWGSHYKVEVQMPDGPLQIQVRQSTLESQGLLLDNPKNRERYPVPDWEQLDLEQLHWPKLMAPAGIRVNPKEFGGFIAKVAETCGGIDIAGTDMNISMHNSYRTGDLRPSDTTIYAFPSEDRAKAFMELLQWTDWYGKTNYAAGVDKGHKLLVELNEGSLTMDMFDRRVQEENRTVYARNPWKEG